MEVAITGASGLLGTALGRSLEADGHTVRRLARPSDWDPAAGTIEASRLEGLDAVVHLAGRSIGAKRWSAAERKAIHDSRSEGTKLLATTLARLDGPPRVLLSASGAHFYGDRGDEILTEDSSPGSGFLAGVVKDWEAAAQPAIDAGIRTVFVRSGVALSSHGGAFPKMALPFRFGLGGRIGSGKQWLSWVTVTDHIAAQRFVIDNDDVSGPVNFVAPEPVTNQTFTRALGKALRRPTLLPVPKFGPRLLVGKEFADEILFGSLRVEPTRLTDAGFKFGHPDIAAGLEEALRK